MAASLPGVFNVQQFTDAGVPAASYRLYTYTRGTTTHKTAYTDSAGLVAHTYTSDGSGGQYIALNARGELAAPLFLSAGPYDLALKTAAGSTVWTRYAEGVGQVSVDLAGVAGAGLVSYSADQPYLTGTVGDDLRNRIDVSSAPFLASPASSASDNTAAIVAALAQCGAGKTLYFAKPGLYKVQASVVDAAIVLPVGVNLEMAPGAWLTADSSFGSFIAPLGRNRIRANIDGAGYPASGGVTGTWTLENVGIRAYFSAPIGKGAAGVIVEGCHIKNVSYAIQTEGAQDWRVINNTFERCKLTAVLMGYLTAFDCTRNTIGLNRFDDCGDYAVAFWEATVGTGSVSHSSVSSNFARNCNQATNGYAFGVEQGDATRQHHMVFVGNTYVTAGSGSVTVGGITVSTCSDTVVASNMLVCPATTQAKGINCVSSSNVLVHGNILEGWTDCAIDTDGSDGVTLDGNVIRDCGGNSSTYPAVRLAATLSTSNIRLLGGSITISPGYSMSGTAVAAVRALVAATKTVKNLTVKGVTFTNPNDRAVSFEGIVGAPILNAEVSSCTVNGIGSATFFGREVVFADYVNDLTVSDVVAMDAKRGIAATNCDGATLARNEFKGSQTITTLYDITGSSNLRIRDDIVSAPVTVNVTPSARMTTNGNSAQGCVSIVTEASGTTGAIASGATVSHGLFTTPTQVLLTPTSAAVACAGTARGATTFTVSFGGGGTQTFDWQAVIR